MRIGIDIDGVLTDIERFVVDYVPKYCIENNIEYKIGESDYSICKTFNINKEQGNNFWDTYIEDYAKNEKARPFAAEVIKKLKQERNEIYIITARSDDFTKKKINVTQVTENWLEKNKIEVDAIITSAYGETKAQACKDFKIDLMIDDDPYNYRKINAVGKKCLLFDDCERYDMKNNYFTNWLDIEKYIERNH